jgi:DNA repair exonuclease SbcCD ATPase subunit
MDDPKSGGKNMLQAKEFDYSLIDENDRDFLRGKEAAIKQRAAQAIVESGRDLLEAKARVGHGQFLEWLKGCFPWSKSTAYRMMEVAENLKFPTVGNLENIQIKALYLLAQPSTPESAREEVMSRTEAGETLSHAQVKELVEARKTVSDLQDKIKSLEAQMPTNEVLAQIERLNTDLDAALNRPAEVKIVEKIPGDYHSLKEQREALNNEIVALQKKIKSITKSHQDEIDTKVNAKLGELKGTISEREQRLEQIKQDIEKLQIVRNQLDSDVGDIAACRETCRKIRNAMHEIASALQDLLEDHVVHPYCGEEMENLCAEMENGARGFRHYLSRQQRGKAESLIELLAEG